MKKIYKSPELEIIKFKLSMDVLGISDDEVPTSPIGVIEEPDLDDDGL